MKYVLIMVFFTNTSNPYVSSGAHHIIFENKTACESAVLEVGRVARTTAFCEPLYKVKEK